MVRLKPFKIPDGLLHAPLASRKFPGGVVTLWSTGQKFPMEIVAVWSKVLIDMCV